MRVLEGELATAHGAQPEIRIGIHAGPPVIGEVGQRVTAIGDSVNVASRMETAADPGSICMSAALQGLVERLVEASYIGERTLKSRSAL